jgi:hypothetical protein
MPQLPACVSLSFMASCEAPSLIYWMRRRPWLHIQPRRLVFLLLELLYFTLSILTLVMFLALHERLQADAVLLARIMLIAASVSTAAAITVSVGFLMGEGIIISAQDVSAFRALGAMCLSLAYMGYHAHGWACLLMGCAVLQTRSFSRILGWLFIFTGIVWIPTTIVLPLSGVS